MLDFDLVHGRKFSSLGEVLANQSIGVFVHPTLPRRIRMGKVDLRLKIIGNPFVVGELPAVVIGQRVNSVLV